MENEQKSKGDGKISKPNGNPLHGKGVNEKVSFAVLTDSDLSRDTIKGWLQNDLRGIYLTLSEVLSSHDCLEALTDVYYKRYTELHKAKTEQPEIFEK